MPGRSHCLSFPSWQPPKQTITHTILISYCLLYTLFLPYLIFIDALNIQGSKKCVLTSMLIRDLIKTVLKHLVEVHRFILRSSHLGPHWQHRGRVVHLRISLPYFLLIRILLPPDHPLILLNIIYKTNSHTSLPKNRRENHIFFVKIYPNRTLCLDPVSARASRLPTKQNSITQALSPPPRPDAPTSVLFNLRFCMMLRYSRWRFSWFF